MTNLERTAALAATRGVRLVETYRGWDVYAAVGPELRAACPHELDWVQFNAVARMCGPSEVVDDRGDDLQMLGGCYTRPSIREFIDDFEAAREAMPVTAFFGVPEVVTL